MITMKQAEDIIRLTAYVAKAAQVEALKTGKLTESRDVASPAHDGAVNALAEYLAGMMDPREHAKVPA